MIITITIDSAVESVAIQTIALALNVTGTDSDCKGHLANHLKTTVARLYVAGDKIKRDTAANSAAETAAATKITVT
jgi:hypothetical protein